MIDLTTEKEFRRYVLATGETTRDEFFSKPVVTVNAREDEKDEHSYGKVCIEGLDDYYTAEEWVEIKENVDAAFAYAAKLEAEQ